MNKINLAGVFKSTQLWFDRHAPEILLGVGMAMGATATVLAVGATTKAVRLVDAKKEELHVEKLEPKEVIKTTWKCYIPVAMTGLSSIACLIGSHSVSARRTAALAAAYQLSETALTEYKEKVVETIGEKKEKFVRDAVAKEQAIKSTDDLKANNIIITNHGETLFRDYYSGNLFKSDIERIKRAVNELNRRMLLDNYVSLNDFYDELGLDHTGSGDDLGWRIEDGYIDVDFNPQLIEHEGVQVPCVILSYDVAPKYGYDTLA